MISFFSQKQNDGNYTIYRSNFGANSEIFMDGVRGCNVSRIICKLICEYNPIYCQLSFGQTLLPYSCDVSNLNKGD